MKKIGMLFIILSSLIGFCRTTNVDTRFYDGIQVDVEYNAPDNLDTGIPTTNGVDKIIDRLGYACGYSNKHKQPLWVKYRLTREEAMPSFGSTRRQNNFHSDKLLAASSKPDDYKNTGFDKGHLAPAADMSWSEDAMDDSFYMSNMSPQVPECNRGIWKTIETWTRSEACKRGSLVVVSGPIFGTDDTTLVVNGVTVPIGYFKVIYNESSSNRNSIAYVIPNAACTNKFYHYVCTVRSVEKMLGMKFFSKVREDDTKPNSIDFSAWDWPIHFGIEDRYTWFDPISNLNNVSKQPVIVDNMPNIVCPETNDDNGIPCPSNNTDPWFYVTNSPSILPVTTNSFLIDGSEYVFVPIVDGSTSNRPPAVELQKLSK